MVNSTKWGVCQQIEALRQSFFQIDKLPLSDILSKETLKQITEIAGNYRDKIFSPLDTLRTFLWQGK